MFTVMKKGFGLTVGYLLATVLFDFINNKIEERKEEATKSEH